MVFESLVVAGLLYALRDYQIEYCKPLRKHPGLSVRQAAGQSTPHSPHMRCRTEMLTRSRHGCA